MNRLLHAIPLCSQASRLFIHPFEFYSHLAKHRIEVISPTINFSPFGSSSCSIFSLLHSTAPILIQRYGFASPSVHFPLSPSFLPPSKKGEKRRMANPESIATKIRSLKSSLDAGLFAAAVRLSLLLLLVFALLVACLLLPAPFSCCLLLLARLRTGAKLPRKKKDEEGRRRKSRKKRGFRPKFIKFVVDSCSRCKDTGDLDELTRSGMNVGCL